ncbi:MAG: response regulator [Pseudomonadota bacterium]|nr:response regulator [Pseudomonadota bacterium]
MKGPVFIVDDDAAVRDSLDLLLGSAGFETQAFDSAESFLAAQREPGRGCLLSDIRMPGKSGVELLEILRQQGDDCPVVLITGHGDVALAVEAMKRGALDFIEKPFDDARLIEAISGALTKRGEARPAIDPEAAACLAALSRRERQVMEGLLDGQSNKEIARNYGISPRTVEVYRAHVMGKMRADTFSELVQIAIRAGLRKN